ncbi:MAG: type II toxin-antitoxin system RelE/ParE family toxin [Thermodesulfobacteriota bacterium]
MKERKLLIADQAQEDLLDIWLYIASDSPLAADAFLDLLHDRCLSLCASPEIGRARDELLAGLRCLPVKRYMIFYRVKPKALEIVRVLSGYRDSASMF